MFCFEEAGFDSFEPAPVTSSQTNRAYKSPRPLSLSPYATWKQKGCGTQIKHKRDVDIG